MSKTTWSLEENVSDYLIRHSVKDDEILRRLRHETAAMPHGRMQISPEQGQLMGMLVHMLNGRRAIEVGTFTGYSALCVARELGAEGKLVACDISDEYTQIARRYWREAGLADRIDLRLGPGKASLEHLLAEGGEGRYDFAFIDADKTGYDDYYELCLRLLRRGGLVAIDNVLWSGKVADPSDNDADTVAIRALNKKVHADERVHMCMIPIGDGLTLALKR